MIEKQKRLISLKVALGPLLITSLFLAACLSPSGPDAAPIDTPIDTRIDTRIATPDEAITRAAPPASAFQSEEIELEQKLKATPPGRDLRELGKRLKGISTTEDETSSPPVTAEREIGDVEEFWIADQSRKAYFRVSAKLRHKTEHAYFYVEEGQEVADERLQQSGEVFESGIYPAVRAYFGGEAYPGARGDSHITILHANLPGAQGYYSSADEYPVAINPYSNERSMIYINLRGAGPGTEGYFATLAHELQHLIHWNLDSSEDTWINEGLSELAVRLAGFATSGTERSFRSNPDTQLNAWASDSARSLPHYGAAYLFASYLAEHHGGYDRLPELVTDQARGISGVDRYLAQLGSSATFDDVFEDWVIANFLDDAELEGGRYGYRDLDFRLTPQDARDNPRGDDATVRQYAADYLDLGEISGDYVINFTGTTSVKLLDNEPRSAKRQWWSNRGDGMNTRLTRAFDLSGLSTATLRFSAWFDIEKDYDYAYVEVSTDGGATWTTLRGQHNTDSNPNGNNFGFGYTGRSGQSAGGSSPSLQEPRSPQSPESPQSPQTPSWIDERIDLSPYAGRKVQVRFEYITDDAYNGPGFAVDDISVPELGYRHDAEAEEDWTADGFILSGNAVPQRYYVQVVKLGPQKTVESVPLDDERRGRLSIQATSPTRIVLVVAAAAPSTTEPAVYNYSLEAAR